MRQIKIDLTFSSNFEFFELFCQISGGKFSAAIVNRGHVDGEEGGVEELQVFARIRITNVAGKRFRRGRKILLGDFISEVGECEVALVLVHVGQVFVDAEQARNRFVLLRFYDGS